ncbi:bifunctional DNA primase/polymerase [Sinorhizobium fredii]|uniref:DNA primase/polymerase protein n=1 Tax=Rhizobium fredii TaxID=380 RepID=A0A2L0H919_RHIFR|nr:bifunctional DNA primase/polymerase [Sinorhizobium fredii]AUX77995.1 DNA primase/polymerase protein [Sinorhizobium fredii]
MAVDLVSAALQYAALGWPVFPVNPRNKRPLVEHGLKAATTDADTITAWWRKFPKAMIGLVTGAPSGLVVLDIDQDEAKGLDGGASLAALLNGAGVTETLTARTPRGGQHLYFAHPHDRVIRNSASKLGPGLDVRGDGGYVIAPPSINAADAAYQWEPSWRPIQPCPAWLLPKPEARRPKPNGHDTSAHLDDARRRAYGETALRGECDKVACALEPRRNDTLFKSGCRLFELVASGILSESEVRDALWSASRACGLDDDEIGGTINSAYEHGSQQPRGPRPNSDSNRSYRPQQDNGSATGTANGHAIEHSEIYDAADLRFQTFAPLRQIAGEIIVEGLTVLAARPKVGKTWLMLDIAIAVSEGGYCLGNLECEQGDVLFLALEDNPRRFQRRLTKLLGVHKREWPRFKVAHKWPRADQGGLDQLRNWIASAENPRLIVIDVFARFRKPVPAGKQNYDTDYGSISELQSLAAEIGVAIVVVHHLRKSEADDDPLDTVSGTLGLTAAADSILVINKTAQGTSIYGRGRDTDEIDLAMKFDPETARWTILGERPEVERSDERRAIIRVLEEAGEPMSPKDIAAALGRKDVSVRALLSKMLKKGEITQPKYGVYAISSPPGNSGNTGNSSTEEGSETQQNQGFWWNR